MCGIAGILKIWPADQRTLALNTPHVHAIPEAWLDILDDSIKHRGPDGHGRFRDRALRADGCVVDVAFVHRRLSIIDHAGGHQPMLSLGKGQGVVTGVKRFALGDGLGLYERDAASELFGASGNDLEALSASEGQPQQTPGASEGRSSADRVCVVFNGCIYNHRELRAELQKAGHVFSTDHSDTEVLVHGWREWENSESPLPARTDGMFSFSVWDAARALVFLARDRAGEKPLHIGSCVTDSCEVTVFASVAAAPLRLVAAMGATDQQHISGRHVASWLRFGFGPQSPSAYCGHVAPSCMTRVDRHPLCCTPYESMPAFPQPSLPRRNRPLDVNQLEPLLETAVVSRLEADVPIGCFLSGGVDSGLVAALACKHVGRLETFTVRMPDARYDESAAATRTAELLGAAHTVLDCNMQPATDLCFIIEQVGLPFGDSSLLPSLWLSRATRNVVKVSLSGDGGDDLFVGYERQRVARVLSSPARPLLVLGMFASLLGAGPDPKSRLSKVQRLGEAARYGGLADLLSVFPESLLRNLTAQPPALPPKSWNNAGVAGALLIDRWFYLPYDLMTKSDSASMSVGLEVRSPMLAKDVMDRAMSAPISDLMPHNQRKGLLRQVARKYLPAEIVDRPKMGFAIPIGEWFRTDYGGLRSMLLDHLNSSEPFGSPSLGIDLNMKFVRQMLDEHLGTGHSGRVVRDHSQRLYMLLVLSIWAKWLSGLK